jgi:hypothetical protein
MKLLIMQFSPTFCHKVGNLTEENLCVSIRVSHEVLMMT